MTYIFLMAGKGSRLHPLTLKYPKSLYKLDKNTSVLERMVSLIKKYDKEANIIAVVGFMKDKIKEGIKGVTFIDNPFFEVTNSIASLWFARQFLNNSQVTIINGDIVVEEKIAKDFFGKPITRPEVFIDSSIKTTGDYNVQVNAGRILVMSKELEECYGEYAGITRLDEESALKLKNCVEMMVEGGMYDQWYENALVQMIFNEDFELFYQDISNYKWTEVDCVSDMLLAKQIHMNH